MTLLTRSIILGIFGFLLFFLPHNSSAPAAQASTATSVKIKPILPVATSIGLPTRLKIPSIGVNARIDLVALTKNGSMDSPKIPSSVAWYKLGPRPGEVGSAVIDGHVNWWNGDPAAFAKLSKLKPGDKIIVQYDKGPNVYFVVSSSQRLGASANATKVFYSNDGQAHLNLVTCIGVWNKKTKQYNQRLVVFADKE